MQSRDSSPTSSLRLRKERLNQWAERSVCSSRDSSDDQSELLNLKKLQMTPGLHGMPNMTKRASMLVSKMRMLNTRESPRRDSIHRSLQLKRRFSGRHLTPLARSTHKHRIKTSVEKKRDNGVKFVDPQALPDRESPTRYGNYLVRVFDGNMSETKEELATRLLNTSQTTRTTQWRRSIMLSDYASSDENSSVRSIHPIKEKRTSRKKNHRIKAPSLFKRKQDNQTAPSTPHCQTPTSARSVASSHSFVSSALERSAFFPLKSARSQFSSPFKVKTLRERLLPKTTSQEGLPQLLSQGKLALLKRERGTSDEPISRFLERRGQREEEQQKVEKKRELTPLVRLSEVEKPNSTQVSPRARIDGIHKLMILGRNCQVEMSSVLSQALRAKEQESVEKELHKALFGLQQMQSRQVRGAVRKYKLLRKDLEPMA